jgi:hypothetical protein
MVADGLPDGLDLQLLRSAMPSLQHGADTDEQGFRLFAVAAGFRRLARDYERLPETLAGLHFLALMCLMLKKALPLLAVST